LYAQSDIAIAAELPNASGPMDEEILFRFVRGEATPAEVEAVWAWRRGSPAHETQFRQVAGILARIGDLDRDARVRPPPDPEAVIAMFGSGGQSASPRRWFRYRYHLTALAAAAAVLVVASRLVVLRGPERRVVFAAQQFVTGATETATFELQDGTVVRLAPRSRLRLLEEQDARAVALEGRAYFAVAKNKNLPFRIRTSAGEMKVLGTRFDLEAVQQDLRLVVVEGRVEVAVAGQKPIEVRAREMSQVRRGEVLPIIKVPDVNAIVRWTGRFMAFQSTPLRDVIHEIERQYGVRVRLADSSMAQQTVSAWYTDEPLESVLGVLCRIIESKCSIVGSTVTIESY